MFNISFQKRFLTGNWFSLCMWFHCLYISRVICWQEISCFVYNILMTGEYRQVTRNWCFYGRLFSLPMIWLEWWLEWKNFHTFVRCEFVTLWRMVLVKSDYVVRGITPIAYSMCLFYTCCDFPFLLFCWYD